jgi:hypothetical protein
VACISTHGYCRLGSYSLEDEYEEEFDIDGGACIDRGDGKEMECVVQWWSSKMEGGWALRGTVVSLILQNSNSSLNCLALSQTL